MKTRRNTLAKVALGMLPVAYIGLAAPGWAISSKYVPPTNEIEPPIHTVEVESEHLVDTWNVEATVAWTEVQERSVENVAAIEIQEGMPLASGTPIVASASESLFAIRCNDKPRDVSGTEFGGEFLKCVHGLLESEGYSISSADKADQVLGESTQKALQGFYASHLARVPWDNGHWSAEASILERGIAEANADLAHAKEVLEDKWSTGLEKIRALNAEADAKKEIDRIELELRDVHDRRGPVLHASDWFQMPGGESTTFLGEDEGKLQFGVGETIAIVNIPANAVNAADLGVSSDLFDEVTISDIGAELVNPETGMAEVQVTVDGIQGLGLGAGDSLDLQFTANDSIEEVLHAPAGVLRSSESGFFVNKVNAEGVTERIDVIDPTIISDQLVLDGVAGIEAGSKLQVI